MEVPAPVREAIARILIKADPATYAALRLVSHGWKDAADQAVRMLSPRRRGLSMR